MTQPTVPTDLRDDRLEDFRTRDRARDMADALLSYASSRAIACAYPESADGFRADAKAALHSHPELLSLVEGKPKAAPTTGVVRCGPCGTGGNHEFCQAHDWHRAR